MNSDDQYDLFEAYLQGDFSEEDKKRFEQLLEKDPELLVDFRLHQLTTDILVDQRLNKLKQEFVLRKKRTSLRNKLLLGALALAVLGGVVYVSVPENEKTEVSQPKTDYTIPEPLKKDSLATENRDVTPLGTQALPKIEVPTIEPNVIKDSIETIPSDSSINTVEKDTSALQQPKIKENVVLKEKTLMASKNFTTPKEDINVEKNEDHTISISKEQESNSVTFGKEESSTPTTQKVNLELVPQYQDYDHFPFKDNQNGNLRIYSKQGSLIKEIRIVNSQPSYWDGTNTSGIVIPGYYIYKFEGDDRSIITGGITVID